MSDRRYGPRTALIVVDVQNDFADPKGSLYVAGAEAILPLVNSEASRATEAGAFVVYTQDWHPEHTLHFAKDGGIWPDHCIGGTWGAEFHPDLAVVGPSVHKGANGEDGYSGFTMKDPVTGETIATQLGAMLSAHSIEKAVVVGLATDYCVSATAVDAAELGFEVEVLQDAIASVNLSPGDGDAAIERMTAAGCILGSCFGPVPGQAEQPRAPTPDPSPPGA